MGRGVWQRAAANRFRAGARRVWRAGFGGRNRWRPNTAGVRCQARFRHPSRPCTKTFARTCCSLPAIHLGSYGARQKSATSKPTHGTGVGLLFSPVGYGIDLAFARTRRVHTLEIIAGEAGRKAPEAKCLMGAAIVNIERVALVMASDTLSSSVLGVGGQCVVLSFRRRSAETPLRATLSGQATEPPAPNATPTVAGTMLPTTTDSTATLANFVQYDDVRGCVVVHQWQVRHVCLQSVCLAWQYGSGNPRELQAYGTPGLSSVRQVVGPLLASAPANHDRWRCCGEYGREGHCCRRSPTSLCARHEKCTGCRCSLAKSAI